MTDSFQFLTRIQYTVRTTQRGLARLLDSIAEAGISICGYVIWNDANDCSTNARIVVGYPDSVNSNWDQQMIEILKVGRYNAQYKNVLQVIGSPPGTVGVIRTIWGALFCKVDIVDIYLSEGLPGLNLRIVDCKDSDDIPKVMRILSANPIPQCLRQ